MRRVGIFIGVLLVLCGLLVAAPVSLARWRYQSAHAVIKDVFFQPAGDGLVRLQVVFEFTIIEHGSRVTYSSFAGNQADARLRRIPDPVLPVAIAHQRARTLLGEDPRWQSTCTVYYPADDPSLAFMVASPTGGASHAYEVGLSLLAGGFLCVMMARRSGRNEA